MSETDGLYVRTRGKLFGPMSEPDLLLSLKDGLVSFSAWIFGFGQDRRWRLLAEIEELRRQHPDYESRPDADPHTASPESREALRELKAQAKASRAGACDGEIRATVSAEPVWFYVRDKKKHGPLSAAELVGLLQRKQLDPGTFVWRPGFATWQRMSAVSEFSRDAMKRLATSASAAKGDAETVDILVKRKTKRVPYDVEIIAHDNTRAIEGRSMVIGEGGLFLATGRSKHAAHKIGARLRLHFREGQAPAFNAVAEVVSIVRGENAGYCMRFVALSDADRRKIAKLVKETA